MSRLFYTASLLLAASAGASDVIGRSVSDLGSLFPRQGTGLNPSDIPPSCQGDCSNIVNSLNSCTSTDCLCTPANGRGLQACVTCLYNLSPTDALRQQGQSILDNFVAGCNGAVPPLTIGGSSSSSGGASAPAQPSITSSTSSALYGPGGVSSSISSFTFSTTTHSSGTSGRQTITSSPSTTTGPTTVSGAVQLPLGSSYFMATLALVGGAALALLF